MDQPHFRTSLTARAYANLYDLTLAVFGKVHVDAVRLLPLRKVQERSLGFFRRHAAA